jgi:hypothetical protein
MNSNDTFSYHAMAINSAINTQAPDIVSFDGDIKNYAARLAARIAPRFAKSSEVWMDIAKEVADAKCKIKSQGGKNFSAGWEEFCNGLGISKTVGARWAKLGAFSELYRYQDALRCTDSWTTLYAITTLPREARDRFISEVLMQKKIFNGKTVEKYRNGSNEHSHYVLLTIEAEQEVLINMTSEQKSRLEAALQMVISLTEEYESASSVKLGVKRKHEKQVIESTLGMEGAFLTYREAAKVAYKNANSAPMHV